MRDPTEQEDEEQDEVRSEKKKGRCCILNLKSAPFANTSERIFVREEMMAIIDEIKEQMRARKKHTLTTGAPGVGKTTAALVTFKLLWKEHPNHHFVLQRNRAGSWSLQMAKSACFTTK
mmetsp:Transcript_26515/g.36951  ORF Transcript_26515/g.36951 Transcript_26515/m.36951 type:complete len:119 (+) Transcript_26515:535-891(+)